MVKEKCSVGFNTKTSRTRIIGSGRPHSRELHGPKPENIEDGAESGRDLRAKRGWKSVERVSSPRAVDVFQELLGGAEPVVGMRFTDGKYRNAEFEITKILPNGDIVVKQVADERGAEDGNYTLTNTFSATGLEDVANKEANTSQPSRFARSLSREEIDEMRELLGVAGVAEATPVDTSGEGVSEPGERAVSEEPADQPGLNDLVFPEPGTIRGAQHGGTNVIYDDKDTITTAAVDVGADAADGSGSSDVIDNDATKAIDEQAPLTGRRRKGGQREQKKTVRDASTIEPPSTTIPPNTDSVSAMTPAETPPVNQDTADDMSFESNPIAPSEQTADRYKDGSVWVEEYLVEADRSADEKNYVSGELAPASTSKPTGEARSIADILGEDDLSKRPNVKGLVPTKAGANDEELVGFGVPFEPTAIVRKRDDPLHTRNTPPAMVRTREDPRHSRHTSPDEIVGDEFDEANPDTASVAAPGSAEADRIAQAFGRGLNGEIRHDEERESTPKGKLQERINAFASDCDRARLEYVTADNESRTVMSRLRGILGISGKGIQNEAVTQKKEAYQSKLRELRDLRLDLVKMRHLDRTSSEKVTNTDELNDGSEGEPTMDLSDLDEQSLLEKELEAELRHFAQEVNIGLYNAWTELRSEQKGILGRLKQFGASYNKLSWQKKLIIGIPVAGLVAASGVGLLGSAMASAAIAAVIARRGVVAAGMFTTVDGGLQKLAESRAQKMAEKIVMQGQQEAASLKAMTMSEANEGGVVGSKVVSSESNSESSDLDAKLERMKTFMDNHMIDSLDQTLASRVRGQDRRRLGALATGVGVGFGLPAFMSSEMGHVAMEKVGTAASSVAEAVFGDDYIPNSAPTEGAGAVQEAVKSASSSADAGVSAVRGASGVALEQSALDGGVKSAGNIPKILGNEITLKRGDSVWKLAGNMAKELGVKGEAENLYVTDALKDAYLAHGGDPNIKVGEAFDWKKYLSAEDIQKALKAADSLTSEQKASILANKGKDVVAAIMSESSTGEVAASEPVVTPDGTVTRYPEALARARGAGSTTLVGADGRDVYTISGIQAENIASIQGDLIVAGSEAPTTGDASLGAESILVPPATEQFIDIPGMGSINLTTLESVEAVLKTGPAAQWTLRQLAEVAQNPRALPAGVTAADVARMKEILVSIPGASTKEFLATNADRTVREIIQDNVRAPIVKIKGVEI